jgi:hypothetical protein
MLDEAFIEAGHWPSKASILIDRSPWLRDSGDEWEALRGGPDPMDHHL